MTMRLLPVVICVMALAACTKKSDSGKDSLARAALLQQLKTTHNIKEWFVPVNIALEDLTPEQAMWRDSSGNHSVGQLAYHLAYWNGRVLTRMNGMDPKEMPESNEVTFNSFNKENWQATVMRLDSILTGLEKFVETADEDKLRQWAPEIANISTHNAYHTGQIIHQRKLQGSWNPEKGVK